MCFKREQVLVTLGHGKSRLLSAFTTPEQRVRRFGRLAKGTSGVAHVRGRIDDHWRREQELRGTRLAGGHGGAAAQASRGGGPGCGNSGCGVGGYRRRGRKEGR